MEFADVISAISSVGFPIAACIGLFYLYDKTIKDLTTTLNKIDVTMDSIKEAISGIITTKDD